MVEGLIVYKLGNKSQTILAGVHADLAKVVRRAIELTTQDFAVGEGLRTVARQKQLVASGKSKTMNSRHLTGHAVDLWAWDFGIDWAFDKYAPIALAMAQAAKELNIPIVWGACWDDITGMDANQLTQSIESYKQRVAHPLIDCPHFQLPRTEYP